MIMAKKKAYRDELMGVQMLQGLLFRHHRRRSRLSHALPLLSAVFGCFLLLFAIILFVSPPVSDQSRRRRHFNATFNNREDTHMNAERDNVFRVPRSGGMISRELWASNGSNFFYGCSGATHEFQPAAMHSETNRYLLIATSGGLNQQRTGIVDAVVAAYILNATLIVPKLDQKSFWKDASNFSEIFNIHWFINQVAKEVRVAEKLPENAGKIITTRAPRKCNRYCYETRILPIYERKHVQAVQLTKFDYRLSNRLGADLQKLRCRVNYHALRFTDPILDMGMKLVRRMRLRSKNFVALHLRYEPDMLAFSGCDYGGGEKEMKELGAIRRRWKTLHRKNPEKARRHGKCPLSPEEVGLMLRALGFGDEVHIYIASGEVYGGEETLTSLKSLFPNIHTKETLATKGELAEFQPYSSRMAALDFTVCDESDVFVSNNNGNMAKILAGKRRYSNHKPTIRPNAKKLYRLFNGRHNMTWHEFASKVRTFQVGFMGEPNEVRPGRGEFHEHPLSCICEKTGSRVAAVADSSLVTRARSDVEISTERGDEGYSEDDQDVSEYLESEYSEEESEVQEEESWLEN